MEFLFYFKNNNNNLSTVFIPQCPRLRHRFKGVKKIIIKSFLPVCLKREARKKVEKGRKVYIIVANIIKKKKKMQILNTYAVIKKCLITAKT